MTAQIVYFDVRHLVRKDFPEHRMSADENAQINRSVSGQLWSRIAESKRRD